MKKSDLRRIIREEIERVLAENEDWFKPTHISKVDWYLVYNSPNKSGAMVAYDPNSKLDTPEGELLIKQGEKLMKHGDSMYNDEEVNVPFSEKYFEKILAEAPLEAPTREKEKIETDTEPTPTRRRTITSPNPKTLPNPKAEDIAEKIAQRFKQGKK